MNFRPRSQRTRITLVTSHSRPPVSPFILKCDYGVGEMAPRKKCQPGINLHSLEIVVRSGRENRTIDRL